MARKLSVEQRLAVAVVDGCVRLGPEAEVTYGGMIGQKLLLHPLSCRRFLAAIITKTCLLLSPALACFRLLLLATRPTSQCRNCPRPPHPPRRQLVYVWLPAVALPAA
jgi:hypothetical protein